MAFDHIVIVLSCTMYVLGQYQFYLTYSGKGGPFMSLWASSHFADGVHQQLVGCIFAKSLHLFTSEAYIWGVSLYHFRENWREITTHAELLHLLSRLVVLHPKVPQLKMLILEKLSRGRLV